MKKFIYSRFLKTFAGLGFVISLMIFIICSFIIFSITEMFGFKAMDCDSYYETSAFKNSLTSEVFTVLDSISRNDKYETTFSNTSEDDIGITLIDFASGTIVNYPYSYLIKHQDNMSIPYSFSTNITDSSFVASNSNEVAPTIATDGSTDATSDVLATSAKVYTASKNVNSFILLSRDNYAQLIMDNGILNYDKETDSAIYSDFSTTCYVYNNHNRILLYSPDENIFFSSDLGWFTVDTAALFDTTELNQNNSSLATYILNSPYKEYNETVNDIINQYNTYLDSTSYLENESTYRGLSYYITSPNLAHGPYSNVKKLEDIKHNSLAYFSYDLSTKELDTDMNITTLDIAKFIPSDFPSTGKITIGVINSTTNQDIFNLEHQIFATYYSHYNLFLLVLIISGLICFLIFCYLLSVTGRVASHLEQVSLIFYDRIFSEISVVVFLLCIIAPFIFYLNEPCDLYSYNSDTILNLSVCLIASIVALLTGLSLIRLLKANSLIKKSLSNRLYTFFKHLITVFFEGKNHTLSTTILYSFYCIAMTGILTILVISASSYDYFIAFLIAIFLITTHTIMGVILIYNASGTSSIMKATKAITEGDFDYKINTTYLHGNKKALAESINHIGEGLQKAIETSVKDERLKAELITNVSHDIKTPLTSIINYVNLLKRENITDETILHYIDVLDQKSNRLKALTEALVEASKVTTGNVEFFKTPLNFSELLKQALGEFEDKFTEKHLTVVDSISCGNTVIFVDGQKTYRILENLFQNVYKYSMEGTRIYADLTTSETKIVFSLKNISASELNISPSELTERFIRGDQARTTEGSGLGLSIAKDLTTLQEGTFDILLDGDLFKVVITFDLYTYPEGEGPEATVDEPGVSENVPQLEEVISDHITPTEPSSLD